VSSPRPRTHTLTRKASSFLKSFAIRANDSLHSDITLTVYTHTVGEDDRVVAEKLARFCALMSNLAKREIFALGEGERIQ